MPSLTEMKRSVACLGYTLSRLSDFEVVEIFQKEYPHHCR